MASFTVAPIYPLLHWFIRCITDFFFFVCFFLLSTESLIYSLMISTNHTQAAHIFNSFTGVPIKKIMRLKQVIKIIRDIPPPHAPPKWIKKNFFKSAKYLQHSLWILYRIGTQMNLLKLLVNPHNFLHNFYSGMMLFYMACWISLCWIQQTETHSEVPTMLTCVSM